MNASDRSILVEELNCAAEELRNADERELNQPAMRLNEAAHALLGVVDSKNDYAFVATFVGECFARANAWSYATTFYEIARETIPPDTDTNTLPTVLANLVNCYANTERLDLAAQIAADLQTRFPTFLDESTNAVFLAYRVNVLIDTVKLDEALSLIDQVIILTSLPYSLLDLFYAFRAKVLALKGARDESAELLSKIKDPDAIATLLDEVKQEVTAAGQPMRIPCAHRVLERAFGKFTFQSGPHPRNHEPSIEEPLLSFKSRVPVDLKQEIDECEAELSLGIVGTTFFDSPGPSPASTRMGLKFHYVDNVPRFQSAWFTHQREKVLKEVLKQSADHWRKLAGTIPYSPNGEIKSDFIHLFEYVSVLIENADAAAKAALVERARSFAMYAANFLEIYTDDPAIAIALWYLRNKLLSGVSELRPPNEGELALAYGRGWSAIYRLSNLTTNTQMLLNTFKNKFLDELVRGHKLLTEQSSLPEVRLLLESINARVSNSTSMVHIELLLGIVAHQNGRPDEALLHFDSAQTLGNSGGRVVINAALAETAFVLRASTRLQRSCHTARQLWGRLGPYAPFIASELIADFAPSDFAELIPDHVSNALSRGSQRDVKLAFIDDHLIVMSNKLGADYVSVWMHELDHAQRRNANQVLLSEENGWMPVKRDVPLASAKSFFRMRERNEHLESLIRWGADTFRQDERTAVYQLKHMISYFDDLLFVESKASYPCGAVLCGMAMGMFEDEDKVANYLDHLAVGEHEFAVKAANSGWKLRL